MSNQVYNNFILQRLAANIPLSNPYGVSGISNVGSFTELSGPPSSPPAPRFVGKAIPPQELKRSTNKIYKQIHKLAEHYSPNDFLKGGAIPDSGDLELSYHDIQAASDGLYNNMPIIVQPPVQFLTPLEREARYKEAVAARAAAEAQSQLPKKKAAAGIGRGCGGGRGKGKVKVDDIRDRFAAKVADL